MSGYSGRDPDPIQDALYADHREKGRRLTALNPNPGAPVPDHIKATPEWRAAKSDTDTAFAKLRAYNSSKAKDSGGSVSGALRIARAAGGGFGADFGAISKYLGRPVGVGEAPAPLHPNPFALSKPHIDTSMPSPGMPETPEPGMVGGGPLDAGASADQRSGLIGEWKNPLTGSNSYAGPKDAWNNLGWGPGGLLHEAANVNPKHVALELARGVANDLPIPGGGTMADRVGNAFNGNPDAKLPADVSRVQPETQWENVSGFEPPTGGGGVDIGPFSPEGHIEMEQLAPPSADAQPDAGISAADAMTEYQGSGQPEKRGGRVRRADGGLAKDVGTVATGTGVGAGTGFVTGGGPAGALNGAKNGALGAIASVVARRMFPNNPEAADLIAQGFLMGPVGAPAVFGGAVEMLGIGKGDDAATLAQHDAEDRAKYPDRYASGGRSVKVNNSNGADVIKALHLARAASGARGPHG